MCVCVILYIYIYIYIYKTRLASNEIFSPSNKIHREIGRDKDLSAPRYLKVEILDDHHISVIGDVKLRSDIDASCSSVLFQTA